MPAPFQIYNTLSKNLESFVPLEEGKIRLYVCGMTVYDHIHVGHGRAMVVFYAFFRYARHRGWDVRFVRNFTDVDDKIIRRAAERGMEPMELAEHYIDAFHEDVRQLGLIDPDEEPRVSESIHSIIDLIQSLIDKGHAYASEGSVWFSVKTAPEYGKLSGQKVDELRSGDEDAGKGAAADFALWKAVKPGEPSWESPWGKGRPGWHIECSAMAKSCLAEQIDIHGGGLDLVFPHHENEIAQSECSSGTSYATYWMHNGLLTMKGGQKMGKSLGNVINIRAALKEYPAECIRLYLLQNHYRSPLPWSGSALNEALAMLARLYDAKEVALQMGGSEKPEQLAKTMGPAAQELWEQSQNFQEKLYEALDKDFNTAIALSHTFELARAINRFAQHKKAKKRGGPLVAKALEGFASFHNALGLLSGDPSSFQKEVKEKRLKAMGLDADDIERSLAARAQARTDKNWSESDRIRDELAEKGVIVMDTPTGVEWKIAL
ncbi:MAG: cysteine--tRNA ligase [Myxococcota bacterium]|nr:cysteine--tRNA ligase [Myxococcota bacterium]